MVASARAHATHRRLVLRTTVLALLTVAAAISGYLSPSPAELEPPPTHASLFPSEVEAHAPLGDCVLSGGKYTFGRWKEPIRDLTFHTDLQWSGRLSRVLRNKAWHFSTADTRDYFLAMAIVQLGYACEAFLYVVDKTKKAAYGYEKFEFSGRHPGSLGLSFVSSSIDEDSCTSFRLLGAESDAISFCYNATSRDWALRANVTLIGDVSSASKVLVADLRLKQQEALTLLFPLGNNSMRPAYAHKAAGSAVTGSFRFGNASVALARQQSSRPALGTLDWSRSMALRCTRWHWISASFRAIVTTSTNNASSPSAVAREASVGINLSSELYDIDGESQENAVWIDGKVYLLHGVVFALPKRPPQGVWRIQSRPDIFDEAVDLAFLPQGGREGHASSLLIATDFVQPYGLLHGSLRFTTNAGEKVTIDVNDAFGVADRHYVLW